MTPGLATTQATDIAGAGRVGILGDNARDLETSAERLRAIGFSLLLVDTPSAIGDPPPTAADVDVMLVRTPLGPTEIVQLLESLPDAPRQVPVWTIVLSRHQSLADPVRRTNPRYRPVLHWTNSRDLPC